MNKIYKIDVHYSNKFNFQQFYFNIHDFYKRYL